MAPRISRYVLAVIAAGVFHTEVAFGQNKLEAPLQLSSLEWLVADSDVIVSGVVVDVAVDQTWNIVTIDVLETLKGAKAERLKFGVHKLDSVDAQLAQAKKSKREQLWILKRQDSGVPGEAPDREKVLARNKTDLYGPFLPGRPGEPSLPVIPLGTLEAGQQLPAILTMNLQTPKTSDELVKAIRTAIAEPGSDCPCEGSVQPYSLAIPQIVAGRTGFSRGQNVLVVPHDRRLEGLARRLVLTPGEFHGENVYELRLEGVKALRLFPSEKNLAIVRTWLDNPMATALTKVEPNTNLVPVIPMSHVARKPGTVEPLPAALAQVPEIHFQQPLTKAMKTADAQLHTAITIDSVNLLNQKKTDAFIETLMSKRPDLAGLSFAMGDACRMKPEAGKNFVVALEVFRKADAAKDGGIRTEKGVSEIGIMPHYKAMSAGQKIDPSASVATLMQVLGHEDGKTRLGLVEYLETLANADATRALAKMAIFSEEADIRSAAVKALKMRRDTEYTDVLVAGLKYPWPAVAERASDAIVKLGRKDLLPNLIEVLETPDPRAPQKQEINGKKVAVVRELVRVNHHHNCLLCHAPANTTKAPKDEAVKPANPLEGLTAQVPVPSESMVAYYRPSVPDILVRFDVTYLRQDFSMKLPVANADPWPEMQRYDFLVRTREVSESEAVAYQGMLPSGPDASPYRRAALSALRELTGADTEPTAPAWRKLTGL